MGFAAFRGMIWIPQRIHDLFDNILMTERSGTVAPKIRDEDFERRIRPKRLKDFIGQEKIKSNLKIFMQAALERGEALDHVLLSGPPGLGKCVTADTLIHTPEGNVPMLRLLPDDLQPGEIRKHTVAVIGACGAEHTSHVYASGPGPTIRLSTSCGRSIEGTFRHPLLAETQGTLRWRTLASIQKGDAVLVCSDDLPADQNGLGFTGKEIAGLEGLVAERPKAGEGFAWSTVTRIESSEKETFDFVIPGSHSFIGNGFCNHNTTLGHIIAEEMGAVITTSSGPVIDKPADLAGILTKLKEGDVLFIDEMHRLSPLVEEYLYSAMEDYYIDIVIDSGPNARSVKIPLPRFTMVGATTRKGLLTAPLRSRFGIDFRYDYYSAELLQAILIRSANILDVSIEQEGAWEIARRSRGTPRIANRLLRRSRDFAQVEGDGCISLKTADRALTALDVDTEGLDDMDTRILLSLIDKFDGGPAGLSTLAVSVGEEAGTIEEVYEPYLIQEGYMQRTARGRVATKRAYQHFNRKITGEVRTLFDEQNGDTSE